MSPDDIDAVGATCRRDQRGDALRAGAATPSARRSPRDTRARETADDPPVAVRSSALGEDSAGGDVRRPAGDLPVGARRRARLRRGARLLGEPVQPAGDQLPRPARARQREDPAMGVTVQLMVDAEVSGVMFTCNPVSGDPSMVAVNASWGLGLAVVGGEVTPDDYLVSKVTREVVRAARSTTRTIEYVPDAAGRGAVRVDVPRRARATPPASTTSACAALVDVGRRVERHFGSPPGHRVGHRRATPASLFVAPVAAGDGAAAPRPPPSHDSAISLVMGTFGAKGRGRPMALSDDDVREILRLIDESDARRASHRDGRPFAARLRGGAAGAEQTGAAGRAPDADRPGRDAGERRTTASRSSSPMLGTFYRAQARARRRSSRSGRRSSPTRSSASSR